MIQIRVVASGRVQGKPLYPTTCPCVCGRRFALAKLKKC